MSLTRVFGGLLFELLGDPGELDEEEYDDGEFCS